MIVLGTFSLGLLKLNPGNNLRFEYGKTVTVDYIDAIALPNKRIFMLSTEYGKQFMLNVTVANQSVKNVVVMDCKVIGNQIFG
jgi:hypothetical protein